MAFIGTKSRYYGTGRGNHWFEGPFGVGGASRTPGKFSLQRNFNFMMDISRTALPVALCAGALAGALASGQADAATARAHYISATAVCSGPLPVYDNQLKRRPLGILNQGTTPVFISCSVPSDYVGDITSVDNFLRIYFRSFGAGGNIACTLNAGNRIFGSGSVALSTTIGAGGDTSIYFGNINKIDPWGSYNFSCNVPADIEMNLILFGDGDTDNSL